MESINKILQETTPINSKSNVSSSSSSTTTTYGRTWLEFFKTKNFLIFLLISILLLLFLGINIFAVIGQIFQLIVYALKPLITGILLLFGVSLNTIGDLFDTFGDIIDSILHIFGNGVQSISKYPGMNSGVNEINLGSNNGGYYNGGNGGYNGGNGGYSEGYYMGSMGGLPTGNDVSPNDTNSTTQQPNMSQNKQSWCLIGDTPGSRTCIPVADSTKCMSGNVYNDQQTCINPTATPDNPAYKSKSGNGNTGTGGANDVYYPYSAGSPSTTAPPPPPTTTTTTTPESFTSFRDASIKSIPAIV